MAADRADRIQREGLTDAQIARSLRAHGRRVLRLFRRPFQRSTSDANLLRLHFPAGATAHQLLSWSGESQKRAALHRWLPQPLCDWASSLCPILCIHPLLDVAVAVDVQFWPLSAAPGPLRCNIAAASRLQMLQCTPLPSQLAELPSLGSQNMTSSLHPVLHASPPFAPQRRLFGTITASPEAR